jgi:hypothetical protein
MWGTSITSTKWQTDHRDGSGTSYKYPVSFKHDDNRPVHIAVTRAADGLTYKWYVNGVLRETIVATTPPPVGGGTLGRLTLFTHPSVVTDTFDFFGVTIEAASLKIVGSELTAAEVNAEFERTLGPVYGTTQQALTIAANAGATEWTAYTPTLTASTTNPTLGTGAELRGSWRRVGDSIEVMQSIQFGTGANCGSGNYYFGLPSGITVDTSKLTSPSTSARWSPIGVGHALEISEPGNRRTCLAVYDVASGKVLLALHANYVVTESLPFVVADGDIFFLRFTLPVVGWSAGVPAVITGVPDAAQNNWAPAGLDVATVVRLNPAAASVITGIAAAGIIAPQKKLVNVSAFNVTLANQDAGSTDVNRIISITGGLILEPDDVADVWYDSTTARWRVV